MANEDSVGGGGGQFVIGVTDNYVVGLFSSDHMLIANTTQQCLALFQMTFYV